MHLFNIGDIVGHHHGGIYRVIEQYVQNQMNLYSLQIIDGRALPKVIPISGMEYLAARESVLSLYMLNPEGQINDFYV